MQSPRHNDDHEKGHQADAVLIGGPRLTIDVDYYKRFLDEAEIPEDQKTELVQAIWSIITSFVQLGFGVHPVQQAGVEEAGRPLNSLGEFIAHTVTENREQETQSEKGAKPRKGPMRARFEKASSPK